jgi:pSer/pThr/pTyr-binding forkhead associated (FHA) protein
VNGRPVSEKVKLENGDLIQIGDTKIRFVQLDGTRPLSE